MPDDPVLAAIRRAIPRYSMLRPGGRLAVAVSGGADSVALLAALREVAPAGGVALSVAHVNHQLRGEDSDADQRFVEALAAEMGLACHVRRGPVGAGENVEQAAREIRRGFFHSLVRDGVADCVATAHTEDDQAETVLLRLLRGTGPGGLAAILPVTQEGLIRPLLDVSRETLRAWAAARGLRWREDASNADPGYARNRVRHDLIPQLEREFNPGLRPLLAQLAALSREDAAHLDALAAELGLVDAAPGGAWLVNIPRLLAQPAALQGRVIRHAVEKVKGGLQRIEYAHIRRVLELAESQAGDGRLQLPGVDVFRSFDWIRFSEWPKADAGNRNWSRAMAEGELELPGGWRLRIGHESGAGDRAYNKGTDWLEIGAVPWEELEVRNWRPGDVFRRTGSDSFEKVKLLFQRGRIPLWERRNWPMVARKDELLWVCGFGAASGFQAEPGSERAITVDVRTWASTAVNPRICLNQNGSGRRLED